MKIGKNIFQNKSIHHSDNSCFEASYKGLEFYISDNHGYGNANTEDFTRYWIEVYSVKYGLYSYQGYSDHQNISDAIKEALRGSDLLIN